MALSLQKQSKDTFPSDTQKNPKDFLAVILRSGNELRESKKNEKDSRNKEAVKEERNQKLEAEKDVAESSKRDLLEEKKKKKNEESIEKEKPQKKEEVRVYRPPLPFPQRLKQAKIDEQFFRFVNMFKKLEVNIPFAEALAQMPNYAKFMKDIINKKRKLEDCGTVNLSANYSVVIQRRMPQTMQDPGSFTIPCAIRNHEFGKALCDSGASINLIPS